MITLWCGLGGLNYYPRPDHTDDVRDFLDACADLGVGSLRFYFGFFHLQRPTVFRLEMGERPFAPERALASFRLYPLSEWDPFRELVEGARARGIGVVGYTSPEYQGALQPNPHSPLEEKLPQLFLSDFANQHPEWWTRDPDGRDALSRDGYVVLSLHFAEVRRHLVGTLSRLAQEYGLDGLELEWLCGSSATRPYGAEADAPYATSVTRFVRQTREALAAETALSTAVLDDLEVGRAWSYDWDRWAGENLIDSLVLRHRARDPGDIASRVRAGRDRVGPQVQLVSQLDCWRETGFRSVAGLREAAAAAREAGSDVIGLYRADAVDAWGLWPTLGEIGGI